MTEITFYVDHTLEFTPQQCADMFKMQASANDVMSTAWRFSTNEEIPYYSAGYVEAVEAVIEYGYKLWKKEDCDGDKLQMELIDILHFAISDELRSMYTTFSFDPVLKHEEKEVPEAYFERWANTALNVNNRQLTVDSATVKFFGDMTFNEVAETFIAQTLRDQKCCMAGLLLMFNKLQMSATRIYGLYIGKNILNKFRTANGQKEGTYVRDWGSCGSDNDYLLKLIDTADRENEALTPEYIEAALIIKYQEVCS